MSTIQETINRLRILHKHASPAPWARTGTKRFSYDDIEPGDLLDGEGFELVPEIETVCPPVDVELIVAARNAIPVLIAEIDRLKAQNAKAWEEGRIEGQYAGRHLERTGYGVLYKNPYEEDSK